MEGQQIEYLDGLIMIYLFTGTPGSSKTLNAIKFISEDVAFKDRPIYCFNVEQLTNDWTVLTAEEAGEWFNLPDGAVIFIDEAQALFPPRSSGKAVPSVVSELNTSRHSGYDLILVTQHPRLIDNSVRRLVGQHTHIERKFGLERSRHYTWGKCVDDVDSSVKRNESVSKTVPFDKKYYGVYKSAALHTHKKRVPWLVILFPIVLILGIVYFILGFLDDFSPDSAASSPANSSAIDSALLSSFSPISDKEALTPQQWIDRLTPRIDDIPWSAPIYDSLNVAASMPIPNCVMSNETGRCQCYSQHGSKMGISAEMCVRYVTDGFFNHTKRPPPLDVARKPFVRPALVQSRSDAIPLWRDKTINNAFNSY